MSGWRCGQSCAVGLPSRSVSPGWRCGQSCAVGLKDIGLHEAEMLCKQGVDKFVGVERDQVMGAFPKTDELDGNSQIALHRNHDPPLG